MSLHFLPIVDPVRVLNNTNSPLLHRRDKCCHILIIDVPDRGVYLAYGGVNILSVFSCHELDWVYCIGFTSVALGTFPCTLHHAVDQRTVVHRNVGARDIEQAHAGTDDRLTRAKVVNNLLVAANEHHEVNPDGLRIVDLLPDVFELSLVLKLNNQSVGSLCFADGEKCSQNGEATGNQGLPFFHPVPDWLSFTHDGKADDREASPKGHVKSNGKAVVGCVPVHSVVPHANSNLPRFQWTGKGMAA